MQIQVYDIDHISADVVKAISAAAQAAGTALAITFPHLAPLAGGLAFGASALIKLIDNLDSSDKIIDERLKLELNSLETGHPLLQPGYNVCFGQEVDTSYNLHLNSNQRVIYGNSGSEFDDCSYAVLEIERHYQVLYDRWEDAQGLAWVMAEINGKQQSGEALHALTKMVSAYTKFKHLERAQQLMDKSELSNAQREWLSAILADSAMSPFLLSPRLLDREPGRYR